MCASITAVNDLFCFSILANVSKFFLYSFFITAELLSKLIFKLITSTHPSLLTFTPAEVFGHLSNLFKTPSLSSSFLTSHPSLSTFTPAKVFGHKSFEFKTPSLSSSPSIASSGIS